jgi:hypothetical protein
MHTPKRREELVRFVDGIDERARGNITMRSVAGLCAIKQKSQFAPNPQIKALITSNVDAILRSYIRAKYNAWLLRTIESAQHSPRAGAIPTYYMHGLVKPYLRGDADAKELIPCVFTEGEYFDFFNRPHTLFNYTFLYLLREFNCVFIGMSMQDQNIRRLLHYSASERRGDPTSDPRRVALRHYAILRNSNSQQVDKFVDLSLRRLGTRVLWIKDFDEIQHRLGQLYGEPAWSEVFG